MNANVEYFKTIAQKLKVISHEDETNKRFFVVENMAKLTNLFNEFCKIEDTIMCVTDIQEGVIAENEGGNALDTPEYSFWILKYANQLDAEQKLDVKQYTYEVGKKVLARMFADQTKALENRSIPHPMMLLDRSHIPYFSIGPVMDNLYGTQFSFSFAKAAKIVIDANDWKE